MRITTTGLNETIKLLEKKAKQTDGILKAGLYDGAGIVANQYKANLWNLPTEKDHNGLPRVVNQNDPKLKGVTRKQKQDLIDSMGISKMENILDKINTSIGVDGYGSIPTTKYPKGVPNAMLLRSIESGTSFREKTPVVRPAKNKSRKRAIASMDAKIHKLIREEK